MAIPARGRLIVLFALAVGFLVPLAGSSSAAGERGVVVWSKGADPEGNLWASVSSVVTLKDKQTLRELEAGYARLLKAMFPAEHEDLGEAKAEPFSAVKVAAKFREGLIAKFKTMGYRVVEVRFTGDADKDIQAFRLERAWAQARARNTEESYKAFLAAFEGSKHAPDARERYERLKAEREALEKRQREEAAWQKAQAADTIASYKAFLAAHGTSSFAEAARTKVRALEEAARQREDAAWAAAQKTDTMAAYKAFIAAHSQSRYLAEARKKLSVAEASWLKKATAAFEAAKAKDTVVAYTAFLTSYADAPEAAEAKGLLAKAKKRESEDNAWAHVQAQNTVASYKAFLAAHPQSRYLTQARAKLAEAEAALRRTQQAAFDKAKSLGTEEAYSRFLTDHPDSAHTVEARTLLGELQAARRRREEDAWSKAKAANTEEAYSAFLRAHPQSTHARDARSRIEAIQAEQRLARLRSSIAGRWHPKKVGGGYGLTIHQQGDRIRVAGKDDLGRPWSLAGTYRARELSMQRTEGSISSWYDVLVSGELSSNGLEVVFTPRIQYKYEGQYGYGFIPSWPRPSPVVYVREDPAADPSQFADVATAGSPMQKPRSPSRKAKPPAEVHGEWRLSATLFDDNEPDKPLRCSRDFPIAIQQQGERVSLGWSDGALDSTVRPVVRTLCGTYRNGRLKALWFKPREDYGHPGGYALEINGWVADDGQSITGTYVYTWWRREQELDIGNTVSKTRGVFKMVRAAGVVDPAAYVNVAAPPADVPRIPWLVRENGLPCFIATAAYGSASEPHVATLREFRDRWLETNAAGRWVTATYYHHSPPLAGAIRHRPWARRLTRILLTPVVVAAGALLGHPRDVVLVVATAIALVVVARQLRRRWWRRAARVGGAAK